MSLLDSFEEGLCYLILVCGCVVGFWWPNRAFFRDLMSQERKQP